MQKRKAKNPLLSDLADARPRVHLYPPCRHGASWMFSIGAAGRKFYGGADAGYACNAALGQICNRAEGGVVIIVEANAEPSFGKETAL